MTDVDRGSILRFAVPGGERLRGIEGDGAAYSATISPDGRRVAILAGTTIDIRDLEGGKVRRLSCDGEPTTAPARSPDGRRIIALARLNEEGKEDAKNAAILTWDVETGDLLSATPAHESDAWIAALSPDGTLLASAGEDGTIRGWDLEREKEIFRIDVPRESVTSLSFSPDGKTLARTGPHGEEEGTGDLHIWDVAAKRPKLRIPTPKPTGREIEVGPERPLAFSPDGKVIARGGPKGSIQIWETGSGKRLRSLDGHEAFVTSIAFSTDGSLLASGDLGGGIAIWDAKTGKRLERSEGHGYGVEYVACSPAGSVLISATWGMNGSARIWDTRTLEERFVLPNYGDDYAEFAFSPDGRTIAYGREDGTIRLLEVDTGGDRLLVAGDGDGVHTLAFSPDGRRVAAGSEEGKVRLWEVAAGREVEGFDAREPAVSLAFSPDGTLLACAGGEGGDVSVREAATGRSVLTLEVEEGPGDPYWVGFTLDGRALIVSYPVISCLVPNDRTLRAFEVLSGVMLWQEKMKATDIFSIRPLAHDGVVVTQSAGEEIVVRHLPSGREALRMKDADESSWHESTGMKLSRSGRLAALEVEPDVIGILEVASGERLLRFDSRKAGVSSVSFSHDGRILASGGEGDTRPILWDLAPPGWKREAADGANDPKALEALWSRLALGRGEDARKGYEAVWTLSAAVDRAVPFLEERLKADPVEDPDWIRRILDDLDDDEFEVRQEAQARLRRLGLLAEPALEEALRQPTSPEMRERAQSLLDEFRSTVRFVEFPSEPLRRLRALWVLEMIDTEKARDLLRWAADHSPFRRERIEAAASLHRMQSRPTK